MKIKDYLENQLSPIFDNDTEALQACVVMVLGKDRRHHLSDLVRMTGYPRDKVKIWKDNLTRSGIWYKDKVYPSGLWEGESAERNLSIDTLVCLGVVSREWNGKDYLYTPVG